MTITKLDFITTLVDALEPSDQLLLVERILAGIRHSLTPPTPEPENHDEDEPQPSGEIWDEEELQALLNDNHPMTSREIVEAGLVGTWADMGIEDSVAWLEERRAKKRQRNAW